MGFSRQEYWNGLPSPSPGDLPDPGIEPGSPELQADSLPTELPGKLVLICVDGVIGKNLKLLRDFKQEGCHSHLGWKKALVIKGHDVAWRMELGTGDEVFPAQLVVVI